jgi:hypothetical protein
MIGGASVVTVTSKVQLLRFPQASVATHVTVRVPTENKLPDAGVQMTLTPPDCASEAVGVGNVTGIGLVPQLFTTMSDGQVMIGSMVSRITVTVKVQFVRSRQSFVTVQRTVLTPIGNRLPDGGVNVTTAFEAQSPATFGVAKVTATGAVPQIQTRRLVGHSNSSGSNRCASARPVKTNITASQVQAEIHPLINFFLTALCHD